jgi:hypothetical protein
LNNGIGYWDNVSLKLCTDNFTKEEVLILVNILNKKFDLKASINKRTSDNGNVCWIIRISNSSINNLRSLVSPFFIPEMLYKLGINKNKIGKDAKWAFIKLHYMRKHPCKSFGPLKRDFFLGKSKMRDNLPEIT